jgi:hypothetical protein
MTYYRRFLLVGLWFMLGLGLPPADLRAQQGPPYTLEQLEGYLAVGLAPELILNRVQRDCLAFRMDTAAEERLRTAGADDAFLQALRGVCYRGPEEAVEPPARPEPTPEPRPQPPVTAGLQVTYDPGSAALRSLLLPGLGQFYTKRPVFGAVFLAGWAGALGLGIMSQEVTVECLDRVTDSCPPNRVLSETVKRPMLAVGVGGAVALAVVSALEARSGANKANLRQLTLGEGTHPGGVLVEVLPAGALPVALAGAGGDLVLLQFRF